MWQAPPSLPVTEVGQIVSGNSGYLSGVPGVICYGDEAVAAAPLPEVDGTIWGMCRVDGDAPTKGPAMLELGGCGL
jgi:hypothetical protein